MANSWPKKGTKEYEKRIAQHRAMLIKRWKDPARRANHSAKLKACWSDPEYRNQLVAIHKKRVGTEKWVATMEKSKATQKTAASRHRKSESAKRLWKDPEHRARMAELRRQAWNDPERRKRGSEASKKMWQKRSKKVYAQKMKEWWKDPKYRRKMSKIRKAHWQDPEARKRHTEATQTTYSHTFARLKKRIEKANSDVRVRKSTKYIGETTPFKLKCRKCKHKWEMVLTKIRGRFANDSIKCPRCEPQRFGAFETKVRKAIEKITGWKFSKVRPDWLRGRSKVPMELDGYNEEHKMGVEAQGKGHYNPIFGEKIFRIIKRNDERKRLICYRRGITLVRVPYFKKDIESFIRAKLQKAR
jgi:hypothetical protein